MKFLLTSGGISNDSIRNALVDLLGKPIAECNALYIPTALHANSNGPALIVRLLRGEFNTSLCEVGVEVVGRAGTHRAANSRERALAPVGPEDGRPAGGRR